MKQKNMISFNHAQPMLDFLGEAACQNNVLDIKKYQTLEELQKIKEELEESINDWDLFIEMQLERNLNEFDLECLRADRKNRQQAIMELRIVKSKIKEMMKNNEKELIAV